VGKNNACLSYCRQGLAVRETYLRIRETHGRYPMTDAEKRAKVTKKYLESGTISDERGSFVYDL
jgi:hypothetical protein